MKDNFEDKVLWNQIKKDVYKKIKKGKKWYSDILVDVYITGINIFPGRTIGIHEK